MKKLDIMTRNRIQSILKRSTSIALKTTQNTILRPARCIKRILRKKMSRQKRLRRKSTPLNYVR
jgi:hypothetical protein